jgi:asparagine synthase (glutamine-hydrolysing)
MCGICGVFHTVAGRAVDRDALRAMNQQIVHRGPDDDGFYVDGNVGLAMRRLSIIDLSTGHQPISNEEGAITIVYNGEIYNHKELRTELERQGHRYSTHSDTETIVHLYEQYGAECVRHLRGMFAFLLWDRTKRVLFGARDRLGIKPFYYCELDRTFLFASEIKALLAHPGVRAERNDEILPEYLAFGYISGPQTFFRGVRKLPAGHTLQISESGELKIEQYWDLRMEPDPEPRPANYYVKGYRDLLEEAVSTHLMSDVPLGVFLSGGLDSSAVAAITARKRSEPIKTFSVGYAETAHSELPYARAVANLLHSDHHEVVVGWEEFFAALPRLVWHEDEPLAWPSSVALYFVARQAREHVTVVLTGEGSDETLAGYGRYALTLWNARADRVYRGLTPGSFRKFVRDAISGSDLGATLRRRLEHTFLGKDGASWPEFYLDNFYAAFSAAEQARLVCGALKDHGPSAYDNTMAFWERSSGFDGAGLLDRLLYTDIKTYLVELLMKQDNMSMAASIESRVPFLDHVLVEYAAKIPKTYATRRLSGKMILKSAVKDLLPDSIVYRKKMGFPTPWSAWMAGPQLETAAGLLVEPRSLGRGLFRPERIQEIVSQHRQRSHDHADRLWRLLNLELWHRVFVDGDAIDGELRMAQTAPAHSKR